MGPRNGDEDWPTSRRVRDKKETVHVSASRVADSPWDPPVPYQTLEDVVAAGIPVCYLRLVPGEVYAQVRALGRYEAWKARRRDRVRTLNAKQLRRRRRRSNVAFAALCLCIVAFFIKMPDPNQVRSWLGKEPVPATPVQETIKR
jgi:hypothetical protein